TPNGWNISIMLEELGLPYTVIPVNIRAGEQFKPEFFEISPNNRIPAIVDHAPADGGEPFSVFETGAILIYLAEKTGRFLPADMRGRSGEGEGNGGAEVTASRDVIARSACDEAIHSSFLSCLGEMDCFASLAMRV